jgi:hypothetical protein
VAVFCIRTCAIKLFFLPHAHAVGRSEADAERGIEQEARVLDSVLPCSAATIHGSNEKIGFSSPIRALLESPAYRPPRSRIYLSRAFTAPVVEVAKPDTLGRRALA